MRLMTTWLALGLGILTMAACEGSSPDPGSETDIALRGLIQHNGLRGDPALGRDLPSIDEPLAQLGRKLFFSKSLGGDRDSACVTCHHPVLGGGDGLPMSIGVGADDPDLLGPGRTHPDGDLPVPRNAPTTFNIALWENGLFWDARVENLDSGGTRTPDSDYGAPDPDAGATLSEAQSRFPVTSIEEMRGFDFVLDGSNAELRTALEQRLRDDGRWTNEFDTAFGSSEISYARIAEAIGAYEDSQVFTDTPWRAYVQGELGAIGESAKRGALLFFRTRDEGGQLCELSQRRLLHRRGLPLDLRTANRSGQRRRPFRHERPRARTRERRPQLPLLFSYFVASERFGDRTVPARGRLRQPRRRRASSLGSSGRDRSLRPGGGARGSLRGLRSQYAGDARLPRGVRQGHRLAASSDRTHGTRRGRPGGLLGNPHGPLRARSRLSQPLDCRPGQR